MGDKVIIVDDTGLIKNIPLVIFSATQKQGGIDDATGTLESATIQLNYLLQACRQFGIINSDLHVSSSSSSSSSSYIDNWSSSSFSSSSSSSSSYSSSSYSSITESSVSSSSSSSADLLYICGEGLSPDSTGQYWQIADFVGYPAFYNGTYYLYWNNGWSDYIVSDVKGEFYAGACWLGPGTGDFIGEYSPQLTFEGILSVSQTPCNYSSSSSISSSSSSSNSSSSSSSYVKNWSSSSTESSSSSSSSGDVLYVRGNPGPDVKGVYNLNGTYQGYPAYERTDGSYWIFTIFDSGTTYKYCIYPTKESDLSPPALACFIMNDTQPIGSYGGVNGNTGFAIVSQI